MGADLSAGAAERDENAPPSGGTGRTALSGGLWNAASLVLPLGSTLALSVVIGRVLGPDLLGEQSLIAFVTSLVTSLGIFSFTNASIQMLAASSGADDAARTAHLARWSSSAHLLGGGAAAVFLVVFGTGHGTLHSAWYAAAACALLDAVGWALAAQVVARKGWAAVSRRRLLAQGLSPLLGIAAVLLGAGVLGVFASQTAVSLVLTLALWRLHGNTVGSAVRRREGRPAWRPVARLWGLFALSAVIGQVVDRRVEFLFLQRYSPARELAMYSVAFNVVGVALTVCTSVIGSAVPAVAASHAAGREDAVQAGLARASRLLVVLSVLLAAGVVALGPATVRLFYGAPFDDAAGLAPWLAVSLLFVPVGHLYSVYWTAVGRLAPVLVSGGAAACLDLGLSAVLIPSYGASGAVAANVGAQVLAALTLSAYTWARGNTPDLEGRRVVLAAALGVVACLVARGATGVLPGLLGLVLGAAVLLVVSVVGLRGLRLLPAPDVAWLTAILPGPAARLARHLAPARGPAGA